MECALARHGSPRILALRIMSEETAQLVAEGNAPERLTAKKVGINLLKLAMGVLAIYMIIRKVDEKLVFAYMSSVHVPLLLLAFLSFFVSKIFAAFRINRYYRTRDLQITDLHNYKLTLAAMFYNLFIPIVGGEGFKVIWLNKEYGTPVKGLIWASLLDRVSGLAMLVALFLLIMPFTALDIPYKNLSPLLIVLMFIVYFVVHRTFYRNYHPAWFSVNGFSLVMQLFQMLTVWLVLLSLGIEAQRVDYLFVFMVSSLAYMLPFMGARELTFVLGANALGLDPDLSLAISLFFYLTLAGNSLLGVYFMVYPNKLKVSDS